LEKHIDQTVRHFIVEHFLYGDQSAPLKPEDSFLDRGIIDSTGVLELVSYIQKEFSIEVYDAEIIPDNFDSISKLTQYILQKQAGVTQAG
jgi:acyl carrier protein